MMVEGLKIVMQREKYQAFIATSRGCVGLPVRDIENYWQGVIAYLLQKGERFDMRNLPNVLKIDAALVKTLRNSMACCDKPDCTHAVAVDTLANKLEEMIGEHLVFQCFQLPTDQYCIWQRMMEYINDGWSFSDARQLFIDIGGHLNIQLEESEELVVL